MKTQFYFPAPVEVVKVTNENLADVATWCGGKVAATPSRRVPGRMDSYVWVPTPAGSSMSWAFPGMYITKRLAVTIKDEMKATYAVFRRDYFSRNFFDSPTEATDKTWEKHRRNHVKETVEAPSPAPKKPKPRFLSKQELDALAAADAEIKPSVHNAQGFNMERVTEAINEMIEPLVKEAIDTITEENNMERSKHGYPVLTEAEAAARKEQANNETVTEEQGLANVEEAFPDAVVVDEKAELFGTGTDIDAGQALEGGEIDPKSFAPSLGDGTEEYADKADEQAKSEWLG